VDLVIAGIILTVSVLTLTALAVFLLWTCQ